MIAIHIQAAAIPISFESITLLPKEEKPNDDLPTKQIVFNEDTFAGVQILNDILAQPTNQKAQSQQIGREDQTMQSVEITDNKELDNEAVSQEGLDQIEAGGTEKVDQSVVNPFCWCLIANSI